MEKEKVFITGLSSAFMQEVVRNLPAEVTITGLSRKKEPPALAKVQWLRGDLNSLQVSDLEGFDVLIHAAAITHARRYNDYYKANFLASKQLFDNAMKAGVKKIVYISSRAAVPGSGGYGETKLLAEEYLKTLSVKWFIFKPAEIFGGLKNEGIETLILDVLTKKRVVFPAGNEKLYPISLNNTADVIRKLSFSQEGWNQTVILSGPKGYTYKELVDLVIKIAGKNVQTIAIPSFVMYGIKWMLGLLPFQLSIVPDQVDRFYALKPSEIREDITDRIEDYIPVVQNRLKA